MEVEVSEFEKQIDQLLIHEKSARMANDLNESVKILKMVAEICFKARQHARFNDLIVQLCKKRGQPKKAQIELVQLAMAEMKTLDLEKRLAMIDAVMKVCEKKIFLEVEYARCVLMLTQHKEDDNRVAEAARILQEVQVETYGSMDKREKLEFILYQMKIMIKQKDFIRLFIISKKIEPKNIQEAEVADLKIIYYSYLVIYYRQENQYLQTADCYLQILETLHKHKVLEPKTEFGFNCQFSNVLENYALYLLISSFSDERQSRLKGILDTFGYQIEQNQALHNLIKQYLGSELINADPNAHGLQGLECFQPTFVHAEARFKEFRRQLIQHNLRIFQLYYDSVFLKRIQQLIAVDITEIEEEVCFMIDKKLLTCKIDRLQGVVQFSTRKNENDVLQDWGNNINKVLNLIDLTCNLIKREEEIYL